MSPAGSGMPDGGVDRPRLPAPRAPRSRSRGSNRRIRDPSSTRWMSADVSGISAGVTVGVTHFFAARNSRESPCIDVMSPGFRWGGHIAWPREGSRQ